jgi:uncharacterized protein YecE (DUF72 family)
MNAMTRVCVGTCSWSDHANFYPPGLPANQQIAYYAERMPIVEIDATFYRMMPARNFALWAERTPPGFIFDVKPYKQLTWHDRENPPADDVARAFSETVQPLRAADKLGALNFQFPPWFMYQEKNLAYLQHVRELFPTDRLAVEFRHRSWYEGEHLGALEDELRRLGVALTVVDEPQIGTGSVPTVLDVTQPGLCVVRFHGRNFQKWYARTKTTGERFDYLYSDQELAEWTPRVRELAGRADEIHLLFNNNAQDYAVRNARQLHLFLDAAFPPGQVIESPASHE